MDGLSQVRRARRLRTSLVSAGTLVLATAVHAQEVGAPVRLPDVDVSTKGPDGAYASQPQYLPATVSVGPLGQQPIKDTPHSINVIPEDLLVNQ